MKCLKVLVQAASLEKQVWELALSRRRLLIALALPPIAAVVEAPCGVASLAGPERVRGDGRNRIFDHVVRGSNFRDQGWTHVKAAISSIYMSPTNFFHATQR